MLLLHRVCAVIRVTWALVSFFVVEGVVFALSILPAALLWEREAGFRMAFAEGWTRTLASCMTFIPAYLVFAFSLMVFSAISTYLTGWRTPRLVETALADFDWPLLNWARYSISIRLVEVFAGLLFYPTLLWTFYMRLNGARLGRRVYVNSLGITDHNLLEFGDGVVVGGSAHISGHTIENGLLKTAPVRLGDNVTVGVGTVVDIGVEAGPGCRIGAMSFVPKFARLEAGAVYVGIPVSKRESSSASSPVAPSESKACRLSA